MEVDVLGSPSLIAQTLIAQELCESRGGRPGLPVPSSPYGLCGRKATLNLRCVKVEVAVPDSNSPCGLCGRKATLNLSSDTDLELRSCVKVEVAVLGSPSLIVLVVSVDVKQH